MTVVKIVMPAPPQFVKITAPNQSAGGGSVALPNHRIAVGTSENNVGSFELLSYREPVAGLGYLSAGYIDMGFLNSYFGMNVSAFGKFEIRQNLTRLVIDRVTDGGEFNFQIDEPKLKIRNSNTIITPSDIATDKMMRMDAIGMRIGALSTMDTSNTVALDVDGRVKLRTLPTSPAGLSSGELWNDAGTIKIV